MLYHDFLTGWRFHPIIHQSCVVTRCHIAYTTTNDISGARLIFEEVYLLHQQER